MRLSSALLPALLLSFGCASALRQPYRPLRESHLKELNPQSLGLMENGACVFGANPPREFGLGMRESEFAGKKAWLLLVQYKGAGPFGIQGGDSLKLSIDGKSRTFNIAPLDIEKKAAGAYVLEKAAYAVDLETLKQMASAEKVELSLKGQDRSAQLCVPDFSRENAKRWLNEELGNKVQGRAKMVKKKAKK